MSYFAGFICNFFPYLHERTGNVTMYAILCIHRPLATGTGGFFKTFPAGPIIVDIFFTPQGQKLQFCFVHFVHLDKAKHKQAVDILENMYTHSQAKDSRRFFFIFFVNFAGVLEIIKFI